MLRLEEWTYDILQDYSVIISYFEQADCNTFDNVACP
jgi:hypothetical protein